MKPSPLAASAFVLATLLAACGSTPIESNEPVSAASESVTVRESVLVSDAPDPQVSGEPPSVESSSAEGRARSEEPLQDVPIAGAQREGARPEEGFELSIWNAPGFKRWVVESYAAETDIEPRLTASEREQLQRILESIAAGKTDKALKDLQKARGAGSSAAFDFTQANLHFQQDELEAARAALEVAVEKHPKFRRAWQNIGVIRFQSGDHAGAIPALTRVIELGGGNAITYGMLGFAYTSVSNYLSAETAYRLAVLMDPATGDWKQGLSFCLFKQGRYSETVALCDSMLAEDAERTDLWMLQANAYLGLEQPLKAAENYELVDRLGKSTAASLDKLGDIYVSEELYEPALGAYLRALELDSKGGAGRALRAAKILASRNATAEAGELLARLEAVAAEPFDAEQQKELLRLRARVALARGAGEEQASVLRELVELDPLDGQALILLAQHHERAGEPEQASFYYERAMSLERYEAEARIGQGQLLVRQGRYKEALPLLRRAQALAPREKVREFIEQVERHASAR